MSELFFVIKMVLFSALLLMALQFKVGRWTLEQRAENLIYRSQLAGEIQDIARGAVVVGQEGWTWISNKAAAVTGAVTEDSEQEK